MANRLEQNPLEQHWRIGPEEERRRADEELFAQTTQTLEREAPLVAEELEGMTPEQKAALDQALNAEGFSWEALKGANAENQARATELLREWKDETDPSKKKEAARRLIDFLE